MPLQNRVTPFGHIVAFADRGTIMGNRGVLHDETRRIVRPFAVRRWIACRLQFRDRHRAIMQPRRWTELFFLDEATAFAAGHRPCAQCRYTDYRRFVDLWQTTFGATWTADAIDRRLDAERRNGQTQRTYTEAIAALPDGTFIAEDETAWLVLGDELIAWTSAGYAERRHRPSTGSTTVVTPPSIVQMFSKGYRPTLHLSVNAALPYRHSIEAQTRDIGVTNALPNKNVHRGGY